MTTPATGPAGPRLDRLEGYLRQDPENVLLLAEAFDVALQAGALDRAEFHLRHAQALGRDRAAWALREAHWLLAGHRFDDARAVLLTLRDDVAPATGLAAVVSHDLAYVALRLGDHPAGLVALRPLVQVAGDGGTLSPTLQCLWLRLLHGAGQIDEAKAWAARRMAAHSLSIEACGVAGLIALDAGDHAASRDWSERALRAGGVCVEALVARASVALLDRDARLARGLLVQALSRQPHDGRTWSAQGFCELLDRQVDAAQAAFEKALSVMPGHVGTWHGLGWTALQSGHLESARRAFDAALSLDRNFSESHGGLAVVQARAGQADLARASIDRALGLDGSSLAARYAQAVLDGEAQDVHALQRLARRLLGGPAAPFVGDLADRPGPPPDAGEP